MMTQEQALGRLNGNDLLQLGMDAGDLRQSLWPEPVITYTVGYRLSVGSATPPHEDSLRDDVRNEIAAAVERGATSLVLSATPASLPAVVAQVSAIHAAFPHLVLSGFSPSEITALCPDRASAAAALRQLAAAGLALFGQAPTSADTLSAGQWLDCHRAAHQAGIPSVAVLLLHSSDTSQDRVALLEQVATLQQETQGFLACEPRIEAMERALDEVTGAQYLKMVALCRLYLATIPHLQVDWNIFGPKVLQIALRFGADDAGLVLASERDRRTPSHHSGEEELRRIIRDAGFQPSQRDAIYGRQFVY